MRARAAPLAPAGLADGAAPGRAAFVFPPVCCRVTASLSARFMYTPSADTTGLPSASRTSSVAVRTSPA